MRIATAVGALARLPQLRTRAGRLKRLVPAAPLEPQVSESALVLPVPSAESNIGALRRKFEPSGISAHVTVLYPFVAAPSISHDVIDAVCEVLSRIEPFNFELSEIGWFEDRVLYLAPTPRAPFEELTALLVDRFPDYPPYRGAFESFIPHLTVGEGARPSQLRRAAGQLTQHMPIKSVAEAVWLMAPDPSGHWELRHTFPLGACPGPEAGHHHPV
jgi:2'-5' RNA ligase